MRQYRLLKVGPGDRPGWAVSRPLHTNTSISYSTMYGYKSGIHAYIRRVFSRFQRYCPTLTAGYYR
jgi:hypothetical protein